MAENSTENRPPIKERIKEIAEHPHDSKGNEIHAELIPSDIEPTDIPNKFDFSEIPEGYGRRYAQQLLEYAVKYAQMSTYINDFESHIDRTNWEIEQMEKLFKEYGNGDRKAWRDPLLPAISHNNKVTRGNISKFEEYAGLLDIDGTTKYFPQSLAELRQVIRRKVTPFEIAKPTPEDPDYMEMIDPWQRASNMEKLDTIKEITSLSLDVLKHFDANKPQE